MQIEMIERPRARRRDPATSHDAAKRAERFARTHAGRILAVFEKNAPIAFTARSLSFLTKLTIVQVDRRLGEMPQIERTGHTASGFTVWRLKPASCFFTERGEADREAMNGR